MDEQDRINTAQITATTIQEDAYLPLSEIRERLNIDPTGLQRIKFDGIVDLTDLNAKSQIAVTIPSGSIIRYVAAYIIQDIISSSTTACIGIGKTASPSTFGFTTDLLAGTNIAGLFNGGPIGSPLATGVVANVSGGGTIGGGNITGGKVHLVVVYDAPSVLTG